MPSLPPRICACGTRVAAGALCECQIRRRRATEKARPAARARGYDTKWAQRARRFSLCPAMNSVPAGAAGGPTWSITKSPTKVIAVSFGIPRTGSR